MKNAIKKALERKGWSITKLSQESGIRLASLSMFINGDKELYSANIEKVLNALDLEVTKKGLKDNNKRFFANFGKEDLNEQLSLLVLCLAYKEQEKQECTLDIQKFNYWAGDKNMVRIEPLIRAIHPANIGLMEREAILFLRATSKEAIEIGENNSTEFLQGLLVRR